MPRPALLYLLLVVTNASAGLPACASPARPTASTRYRVGDFVVYKYTGELVSPPVALREDVTAQIGNRLRIDVRLSRLTESKRWAQVVTDTPENQRSNRVDDLFEFSGDRVIRLANNNNSDLLRLYEWVLVRPSGPSLDQDSHKCTRKLAGTSFDCICSTSRVIAGDRTMRIEDSECAGFLWTHGPTVVTEEDTARTILRVEVTDFGHREVASPEPFDPTQSVPLERLGCHRERGRCE